MLIVPIPSEDKSQILEGVSRFLSSIKGVKETHLFLLLVQMWDVGNCCYFVLGRNFSLEPNWQPGQN